MTRLRARVFELISLETGTVLGRAVLCPSARYAAVALPRTAGLIRRFIASQQWVAVEAELSVALPGRPMEATSTIARVLTDGNAFVVVRYLWDEEREIE